MVIYKQFDYDYDIGYEDYVENIKNLIENNGEEVPSIVIIDGEYVNDLWDTNVFLPLSDVGFEQSDYENMYQYTITRALHDGQLMGMQPFVCPGCYIYRMDVAEEVFGTSDPYEVGQYFATWDGFMEAAEMLKSYGYYIVPETVSVKRCMGNDYNQDIIDSLISNGYSKEENEWESEWGGDINDNVFGYLGCDWMANFILGGVDGLVSQLGICTVPNGYSWGGDYWGVTKNCTNIGLAYLVLYTMCCDEDVLYEKACYEEYEMPNNSNVVQKLIEDGVEPWDHERIGTTNVLSIYDEVGRKIYQ